MVKSKLAQIIDTAVLSLSLALVSYVWLLRLLKNKAIAILISIIIALIIAKITWNISQKRINKHNLKQSELIFAENCIKYLSYNSKDCNIFFLKLLKPNQQIDNFFICENTIYYINYQDEELTLSYAIKIKEFCDNNSHKHIKILTHKISQKASELLSTINCETLSFDDVFLIMKSQNLYPIEKSKTAKTHKFNIKNIIFSLIDRKKAKHFFAYGVLLTIMSLFIPFTFWYCVMGAIFIILGVLSLVLKNKFSNAK